MILLLASALAADPAPSADIVTEVVVAPGPEALAAVLTDLARFQKALPADCVSRFEPGPSTSGKGASARLRYDMGAMHRTLTFTISRLEVTPTRTIVDFDHATDRGFVTRWVLEPGEAGTTVRVRTALNPPPWPFTAYYFKGVHPEWTSCQARFVEGVAAQAGVGG